MRPVKIIIMGGLLFILGVFLIVSSTNQSVEKRTKSNAGEDKCLPSGTYNRTIQGAELKEDFSFELYVPPNPKPNPSLVVQYHGGGSRGRAMEKVTEFTELAKKEGFLVVTPEGYDISPPFMPSQRLWNSGVPRDKLDLPNHVAATRAMLHELDKMGVCFDSKQVYATGHSDGGIMAYRLACQMADRFAAVAVSAGYLADKDYSVQPPQTIFTCEPSRSVPILHVHGLADKCVPYEGGKSKARRGKVSPPIKETIRRWRSMNQCGTGSEVRKGEIRERTWKCKNSTKVKLITVESLGHPWAGSDIYRAKNRCGGTKTDKISTTHQAWKFFKQFELP